MLRKVTIFAIAGAAIAALAIPTTAAAQWTENHQQVTQSSSSVTTGQTKYQGQIGSVECQTVSLAELIGGTTTAQVVLKTDVEGQETVTDNCSVGGGLVSVGCTDVKEIVYENEPWTAHATSTQTIAITTGTIITHLHGGVFCPKTIDVTPGTVHITTSTSNTWTTGQISGALQAMPSTGGNQTMTITGHGTIDPSEITGVA
ncbi:MAG TPA: hypothetical protein VFO36_00305 [Nitrospiraceae bacterium]|nr:hypothetical protein [Nitrospiraceae bacterium]